MGIWCHLGMEPGSIGIINPYKKCKRKQQLFTKATETCREMRAWIVEVVIRTNNNYKNSHNLDIYPT